MADQKVVNEAAKAFYHLAKEYCDFIDSRILNMESLDGFMSLLLQLYLHGLELPYTDDFEEEIETEDVFPHPQIELERDYSKVFDPFSDNPQDELVGGFLDDDLGDIYRDLQTGIGEYEAGHINNACFEWRFNFDHHWGNHLVEALKPLHWLRTDES